MDKIYGINTVIAALEANNVKKIIISSNFNNKKILELANKKNIEITKVNKDYFDKDFKKANHQNIIALINPYKTYTLSEIIKESLNIENYIVCILDEIQDPHNLGAILRSADIFNIKAIIFKKSNQVSLSPLVGKISSGAINYVKCVEVTNLTRAILSLKENKFWVYGLSDGAKKEIKDIDKANKLAIVIGNEGKGISRLVKENCDELIKIQQFGHISCLNASNACAIAFYELTRK